MKYQSPYNGKVWDDQDPDFNPGYYTWSPNRLIKDNPGAAFSLGLITPTEVPGNKPVYSVPPNPGEVAERTRLANIN